MALPADALPLPAALTTAATASASGSFAALADAGAVMDGEGAAYARAVASFVATNRAQLAVAALNLLADTQPALFVTVTEAFTSSSKKLSAPYFHAARFMTQAQDYQHNGQSITTNGSAIIAAQDTALLTAALAQSFKRADESMTPAIKQDPVLFEMAARHAPHWQQRLESLKA